MGLTLPVDVPVGLPGSTPCQYSRDQIWSRLKIVVSDARGERERDSVCVSDELIRSGFKYLSPPLHRGVPK